MRCFSTKSWLCICPRCYCHVYSLILVTLGKVVTDPMPPRPHLAAVPQKTSTSHPPAFRLGLLFLSWPPQRPPPKSSRPDAPPKSSPYLGSEVHSPKHYQGFGMQPRKAIVHCTLSPLCSCYALLCWIWPWDIKVEQSMFFSREVKQRWRIVTLWKNMDIWPLGICRVGRSQRSMWADRNGRTPGQAGLWGWCGLSFCCSRGWIPKITQECKNRRYYHSKYSIQMLKNLYIRIYRY